MTAPTDPSPDRLIRLGGVLNLRDLGGYPVAGGGTTRWGRVFRSASLHRITTAGNDTLASMGIRAVYDLRSAGERELRPSLASSRHLPVTTSVGTDGSASELQTRDDGEQALCKEYKYMLVNAAPDYGALFEMLAEPDDLPAIFHCAGGKDRTGLAAALLLSWLGVDRETVLDDYELTSRFVTADDIADVVDAFCELGMSRAGAEGVLSTPRWAMAAALDELDEIHGGIEAYLAGPAGMSASDLAALRDQLVVEAGS